MTVQKLQYSLKLILLLSISNLSILCYGADKSPEQPVSSDSQFDIADPLDSKIRSMISSGSYASPENISIFRELSSQLSDYWKNKYYEEYKKNGNWAWLNYPFGIGSLVLGDPETSGIQVGLEFVGLGILSFGVVQEMTRDISKDGNMHVPYLVIAGESIGLSGLLYGMIRPWFYVSEENRKLARALDWNPIEE
jgi:hypothetical protein